MSKYISYHDAIHFFGGNFIQIPLRLVDNYESDLLFDFDEDMEPRNEVCQVFVTNLPDETIKKLKSLFPSLRLKYFELLENWILLVDHWGTSWDGVYIDINPEMFEKYEKLFVGKTLER